MFGSFAGILTDLTKVVIAPVEIASTVVRQVTTPLAELAEDLVKEVDDLVKN